MLCQAADKGSKSRIVALGGLLIPVAVGLTSYNPNPNPNPNP